MNETTTFHLLPEDFAIVRLQPEARMPLWAHTTAFAESSFFTLSKSAEEISIVCEERCIPDEITLEAQISRGWRAMRLGTMDLSLVGIAARFTRALADAGVNVNVIATYDTDYIFIQHTKLDIALQSLREAGYEVVKE
jgi:hypothetical protein